MPQAWIAVVGVTAVATGVARADEPVVEGSASVGAGMFGAQPSSTLDVGIDVAGKAGEADYAVGVGGRARWLAVGGFRDEDWDEASEAARVVRYGLFAWADPDGAGEVSAAVGELGGVTLGHGALFDGYASGLDVDHAHVGVQLRGAAGPVAGELVLDDVVAPRIAGARLAIERDEGIVGGVSAAADRTAPGGMDDGTAAVAAAAADAEVRARSAGDGARGAVYVEGVGLAGLGAGLHTGVRGDARAGDARVGARAELRAGSDGYVAGWFGPLYERDRRELVAPRGGRDGQRDVAERGGVGGLGAAGALTVEAPGVLAGSASYAVRPGLSDVASVRIAAPYRASVQVGAWGAALVERLGDTEALALAVELRVRLPRGLFLRGEAARLYQSVHDDDSGMDRLRPLWTALVAVGHVVGD